MSAKRSFVLSALFALAAFMMPRAALPEEVLRARGDRSERSRRGRATNRRAKIRAWLADRNLRLALIHGVPKLRNAAKRVRQGRLSHARLRAMVASTSPDAVYDISTLRVRFGGHLL